MYSILYSQKLAGKSKLYLLTGYMKYDEEFKERVVSLNLFEEVLLVSERNIKKKISALVDEKFELMSSKQREECFDIVIFDHYADLLCGESVYYFFNQTNMIYYYVVRKKIAANIIEDGYKSLVTQDDYVSFISNSARINKFINDGYISLAIDVGVVSRVIGSSTLDEIKKKDFKDKYEEQDFVEMLKGASEEMISKLFHIFEYHHLDIPNNSALILTQPLASARYCYADEQYLLYKKMINKALKKVDVVHIKLHPGDRNIYRGLSNDRVRIIAGKFPIELLLVNESNYDYIYSFDSTSIKGLEVNREKVNVYSHGKNESVTTCIKAYTRKQRIVVGINDSSISNGVIEKLNVSEKYFYQKIEGDSHRETYQNAKKLRCDYVYYNDKKATVNIRKLFKEFEKAMQSNCREIFLTGTTHVIGSEKFNNVIFASRYYYKYFCNKVVGIQVLEAYVRGGNQWIDVMKENYGLYPSNRIRIEFDLQGELRDFIDKDEYGIFLLAKEEKTRLKKMIGTDIEKKYFVAIDKYFIEWLYLLNVSLDCEYDVIKYIGFLENEEREDVIRSVFDHSLKPKKVHGEKEIRKKSGGVDVNNDIDAEGVVKKTSLKRKLKSIVKQGVHG